jgi:hypothetical protein
MHSISFEIDQTTYNHNTNAGFDGGSIMVSGDSTSDLSGTYSFADYAGGSAEFGNSLGSDIYITIDNPPFTSGSLTQFGDLLIDTSSNTDNITSPTAALTATTVGQVPEPTSLALLAGGLAGLFLLTSRANRHDRRCHPQQTERV